LNQQQFPQNKSIEDHGKGALRGAFSCFAGCARGVSIFAKKKTFGTFQLVPVRFVCDMLL
jgi:hypothetical protein